MVLSWADSSSCRCLFEHVNGSVSLSSPGIDVMMMCITHTCNLGISCDYKHGGITSLRVVSRVWGRLLLVNGSATNEMWKKHLWFCKLCQKTIPIKGRNQICFHYLKQKHWPKYKESQKLLRRKADVTPTTKSPTSRSRRNQKLI